MTDARTTLGSRTTDMRVPGACLLCEGDLEVRVTPGSAVAVCGACRWITQLKMSVERGNLHIVYPAAGQA